MLKQFLSEVAWAVFVICRRLKVRVFRLKRLFVQPRLPRNPDGKILIHLGCGCIDSPEFINVDARPGPHIHYVCDVMDLSVFEENSADLVYACHILEHISHRKLKQVLWEWRRILKPGGVLRLSVPDLDKILHIYEGSSRDINSILGPLMGGQDYEYNVHYSVFNHKYLVDKLREVGFKEVRRWDVDFVSNHDFRDFANSEVIVNNRLFPVSLNLEAIK